MKEWRKNNLEKSRLHQRNSARKRKEFVMNIKKNSVCKDCGEDDFRVLIFHHIGNNKTAGVSQMGHHFGMDAIKGEIEKCIVLCSNCHLRRHYDDEMSNRKV
jgi:hypothetical protein